MSLLGSLATIAGDLSPIGAINAVTNKVSGGRIGFDPTPGFSAQNLATNAVLGSGNVPATQTAHGTFGNITPNQNTGVDYNPDGTVKATHTTSNNTTAPAVNLNQSYIDMINGSLGRLPGQLQSAQANIQNQFNTNQNQLQSGYDAAQLQNQQSTAQNGQQFVANKNQINNQASNGLHGLLAILGAHGAGGSSAAQYAAPNAVAQVASQQRAGAGQTFGQNQQGIDTTWNNYQSGFDNSKKQLADWLTTQNNSAQSTSEQTRQGLLQNLLSLQPNVAAAQPFVDQINQSAAKVDQLANFNPTYDGSTPTYTAPNVASYTVNQTGAPVVSAPGGNSGAGVSPLQFLLNLKDKQQQPSF